MSVKIISLTDENNHNMIGFTEEGAIFLPICTNNEKTQISIFRELGEIDKKLATWFIEKLPVTKISSQVIIVKNFIDPIHERKFKQYCLTYGYHIAVEERSTLYLYVRTDNPYEFNIDNSIILQYILLAK